MDQDSKLRLEEAKWFANELGKLSAENQSTVLRAKTIEEVKPVYGANSEKLLKARESWNIENSLGNRIDIPSPRTEHLEKTDELKGESILSPAKATVGATALGSYFAFDRIKNREYYKFKKKRDAYVEEQIEKWKENNDESFAKSEEGAKNRAINEFHDRKLAENPEKFQNWTKKHRDPDMERAIKRKEILDKENPKRDQKELEKYLKEKDIKYPEKAHQDKGDISREEAAKRLESASQKAEQKETPESEVEKLKLQKDKTGGGIATPDQRLEKAAQIGMTKLATPAAAAAHLEKIGDNPSQPDIKTEEATTAEKMARIEEVVKELENKEEIKRKESSRIPQYSKPAPQPSSQGSSFSSGQSTFRAPRIYRRAQRARRRYGPGGVSKGVGKKVGKRGAMAAGRAVATNPYVLAAIGIAIAIIVGFLLLIAVIKYACDLYDDPIDVLASFASDPAGTTSMLVLAYIGRSVGLCESPYQIQVPPNPPGVITEKIGEVKIENGENIPYSILKVTYDSSAPNAISYEEFNSLSLFDVPLYDFAFIEASGNYRRSTAEDGTRYIEWVFAEQASSRSATHEFELTLSPNKSDIRAVNVIYVSDSYKPVEYTSEVLQEGPLTNSGPGVKPCGSRDISDIWYGADCAPTNDKCANDRWERLMGITKTNVEDLIDKKIIDPNKIRGTGYNFGDPLCSFKAAKVDAVIDSLIEAGEETEVRGAFWKDIAYCEGSPNSFGAQDGPIGPAGYFQMNASGARGPDGNYGILFKAWDPNDSVKGDVPWQRQIQNAIRFNNGRKNLTPGQDFTFWGAARCLCWWPEYRVKNYCKDIIDRGVLRDKDYWGCNDNCDERGAEGPSL